MVPKKCVPPPTRASLLCSGPQSQPTTSPRLRLTPKCTAELAHLHRRPAPLPPSRSAVYALTQAGNLQAALTHPSRSYQSFIKALCFVSETSCTSFLSSHPTSTTVTSPHCGSRGPSSPASRPFPSPLAVPLSPCALATSRAWSWHLSSRPLPTTRCSL